MVKRKCRVLRMTELKFDDETGEVTPIPHGPEFMEIELPEDDPSNRLYQLDCALDKNSDFVFEMDEIHTLVKILKRQMDKNTIRRTL